MSMNTLLYGFIIFACDQILVKTSAMSSPIREDGAPLLLYNPSGHDLEQFEYAVKSERSREPTDSLERGRRKEHPGSSYIRIGRSQEQMSGFNNDGGDRTARGRSDNIIRFGRSNLKTPHHKIDELNRGFVRIGKSGSSVYTRLGRSAAVSAIPSEAEMAIICPNILVEEDARGNEDVQLYLSKLMYICNNNNNNNNAANAEKSEDNLHRNNLEYVEVNGDTV